MPDNRNNYSRMGYVPGQSTAQNSNQTNRRRSSQQSNYHNNTHQYTQFYAQGSGQNQQQGYSQSRRQNNDRGQSRGGFRMSGRGVLIAICGVVFTVCAVLLISYAIDAAKIKNLNDLSADIHFSDSDFTDTTEPPMAVVTAVPTPAPTMAAVAVPVMAGDQSTVQSTPQPTVFNGNPWPTSYPNNATLRISNTFYTLRNTYNNDDVCGYLEIEGVVDGQPVTQRDNSYYLTHSVDLQTNQNGALFIDENCDLKTVPAQIIVYGHNMKDGLAFGPLKKYATKDASFYKNHPFITFNTIYENGRYVIFAVIDDLDIRSGQPNYLPFWYYSDFSSVSEFDDYIIKAKALSKYHCSIDVEAGDRLLVLSTCVGTNEYQKNLRFIIMARRIRDNETEFDLQQKIMTSYDK